ncbi:hypothetical protein ABZ639_09620 [Saccharomonospora sp. NPDC006951]
MAWNDQPRDSKGRFASKGGIAAVVTAGVVAFGATTGGVGGTAGSLGSGAGVGKNLAVRKAESTKAARAGRADEAWRRLGLRSARETIRGHTDCVRHSFGDVRRFLIRNPCSSLKRMLFTVGDGKDAMVVSVAWIEFRTRAQAVRFREVIDVHGTGDIAPLAGALAGAAGVRFTGHNYDSRLTRRGLTVAETEPLAGEFSTEDLETVAEVAALLPRP